MSEPGKLRVLVADDHTLMRQGLVALLSDLCGFQVVAEVADGAAAVEVTRKLQPDVVLMDISMPGMTGIEATRAIHRELPRVRVIAISMHDSEQMRREMRLAGAAAYLTKSADASEVCATVRLVAQYAEST